MKRKFTTQFKLLLFVLAVVIIVAVINIFFKKEEIIDSDALPVMEAAEVNKDLIKYEVKEKDTIEKLIECTNLTKEELNIFVDELELDMVIMIDNPALSNSEIEECMLREVNVFSVVDYFDENNLELYELYLEYNPDLSIETVVKEVNMGHYYDFYTNISVIEDPSDPLVLVNKYFQLPNDYVPADLILLPTSYAREDRYLTVDTKAAFEEMLSAMQSAGMDMFVSSAYRSYDYQTTLYNNYKNRDGKEKADTYSARPGHSEHQLGTALDVARYGEGITDFGGTPESEWVKKNAHLYGFIIRYSEGSQEITGYVEEAWHLRYVGVELASLLKNMGITLDEYYALKLDE